MHVRMVPKREEKVNNEAYDAYQGSSETCGLGKHIQSPVICNSGATCSVTG